MATVRMSPMEALHKRFIVSSDTLRALITKGTQGPGSRIALAGTGPAAPEMCWHPPTAKGKPYCGLPPSALFHRPNPMGHVKGSIRDLCDGPSDVIGGLTFRS
jgi:hypothetical protein